MITGPFISESHMRFPNLRYGNPTEFAHYAMGIPLKDLARILRRDERTVSDWLRAKKRVPWWVPEYMRLRQMEQADIRRQMNMTAMDTKMGVVRGEVIELAARRPKKEPQVTDLRLDDFDPIQVTGQLLFLALTELSVCLARRRAAGHYAASNASTRDSMRAAQRMAPKPCSKI